MPPIDAVPPVLLQSSGVLQGPDSLRLPDPPVVPEPEPLPLLTGAAPAAVSVILFVVTGSPYTLLFALLGPLGILASRLDASRRRRRELGRERDRYERELEAVLGELAQARLREGEEFRAASPSAGEIVAGARPVPAGDRPRVRLGLGQVPSRIRLSGDAGAHRELLASSRTIEDAPVLIPLAPELVLRGRPALVVPVARALVVQLVALLDGSVVDEEGVLTGEVQAGTGSASMVRVVGECEVLIRLGPDASPSVSDGTVLEVRGTGLARLDGPGGVRIRPDAVTRAEYRRLLARRAADAGLPEAITLAELVAQHRETAPSTVRPDGDQCDASLSAAIGVAEAGGRLEPCVIDLVTDGPHAVIGGTTGSGKSELLTSWILGMLDGRSPEEATVLLIDFKGGSSFAPLAGLPHCVGFVTDLDGGMALRAASALRAELARRERVLAALGARSIEEAGAGLARLVIVVDEYATILADHPELHALFCDIAARGRSLGCHLILCTQRPQGVVRESVLANCPLRICLRVMDRSDSVSLLGTDAAARLPRQPAGRAVISVAGALRTVQLARSEPGDALRVGGDHERAAPLWLPPLPTLVRSLPESSGSEDAERDGRAFGLLDLPSEQRQTAARWDAARGPLLIVGGRGSGRTGALAALAAIGDAVVCPSDPEGAWDAIHREREAGRGSGAPFLIDDLDLLLARLPADYAAALLETFGALLRERPETAFTTRRIDGGLTSLAALCGSRLVLRLDDRNQHLASGADAAGFDPFAPPGRGLWQGHAVQVLASPALVEPPRASTPALLVPAAGLAVASTEPERLRPLLAALGKVIRLERGAEPGLGGDAGGRILLGDPETWQLHWSLLGRAREAMPFAVHGCGAGEWRMLTRRRSLPPFLAAPASTVWLLAGSGGTVTRATLPDQPSTLSSVTLA